MDVSERVEALLADFERLEWYDWVMKEYYNGWHRNKEKARSLWHAHRERMEDTYGVTDVLGLGKGLRELFGFERMWERQGEGPTVLKRIDNYPERTPRVERNAGTFRRQVEGMRSIDGDSAPIDYDLDWGGDERWTKLRVTEIGGT